MAFLAEKGYRIAPFKVGPDFIDPGYHKAVTGQVSRNLDSWMLSKKYNEKIFSFGSKNADIAVVEGVMGLFDGYSGTSEEGSTSQMAKWLNLPVILIVDARSMARSAAAIVQGFENFDKDLNFAGVIFNRTGSTRHYEYLKEAVEATCKMPCLGFLPRNEKISFPQRHLGLVTADEFLISSDIIAELISMVDENTIIEAAVRNLPDIKLKGTEINSGHDSFSELSLKDHTSNGISCSGHDKIRIAIARDKAFCFYYQENIEILEQSGAEIVFFSPINDMKLPDDISGIYFGGGYPELFADRLSQNVEMLMDVRKKSLQGMPIYGECGGFMYLCSSISGMNPEEKFSMAGCFPFSIVISKKMRSLGYREITLVKDTLVGKKGDILRGHEFHYSFLDDDSNKGLFHTSFSNSSLPEKIYSVANRKKQRLSLDGFQINNTLGSYLHIHFGSAEKFDNGAHIYNGAGKQDMEDVNSIGHSFVSLCAAFKKGLL